MLENRVVQKSCGAAVYRIAGGKRLYLVLHYSEGHWDLPKGHVEAREGEQQTARREILEETGISALGFDPAFRKTIRYSFVEGSRSGTKEVVFFLAKAAGEKVALSDEHVGFEWLPAARAIKKMTYENAKEVLRAAEQRLSSLEPG